MFPPSGDYLRHVYMYLYGIGSRVIAMCSYGICSRVIVLIFAFLFHVQNVVNKKLSANLPMSVLYGS